MTDLCDRDGAQRLAAKIQDFWKKRGFDVSIEVKDEGFVSTMRSARSDVRSNMINGMPTKFFGEAATS
ncbi:phosphoglycolate phosphatase [Hyphococcus sp. DH-69]|uniref:phosphoglycolate phosphatase n=1 Tax=Hyphococcus formosus TaxID=3143534 RepID=UPI00398BAFB7